MNPNMAAFQQMANRMPPGAGAPPMAAPQMMPPPGARPPMPQPQAMVQQLGGMGRLGDTMIAHLTPGEIQVPPQVQSPKVLATLNKEFQKHDIPMQKFTAGSPAASTNPQTGAQEFNFWSSFLPIALGIAGAAFGGPAIAGALGSSALAGSSIAGGLGTTLGGLIGGQDPGQAVAAGLGSGLLGYGAGSLFGGAGGAAAGEAASTGGKAAGDAAATGASAMSNAPISAMGAAGPMTTTGAMQATGAPAAAASPGGFFSNFSVPQAVGSYLGSQIGSSLAAPQPKSQAQYPKGFTDPLPSVDKLPSYDVALGQTTYKGPTPNFSGYNPFSYSPAAYNFYR